MANKAKYSFSEILFTTGFIHNPVLVQAVGLGAVVAVATSLKTALLLALVFAPVMIATQVIASAILKKVPRWIRVTLYLIIGTALIVPIIYFIDIYAPSIRLGAGVYLALTAINSITAIHCEKVAVKTDVKSAFYDASACAVSYGVVIILVGIIREILGNASIWDISLNIPVKFPGLLKPFGGFLIIAFLAAALKAVIKHKYPELINETKLEIKKTAVIVSKKKLQEVENKTAEIKIEEKAEDTAEVQQEDEQKDEAQTEENETDAAKEETATQEENEPSHEKEEEKTPDEPEYDVTSLLKPLDETDENVDNNMFGSFEELKFSKSKTTQDNKDSEIDDILGSFNLADDEKSEEEKK